MWAAFQQLCVCGERAAVAGSVRGISTVCMRKAQKSDFLKWLLHDKVGLYWSQGLEEVSHRNLGSGDRIRARDFSQSVLLLFVVSAKGIWHSDRVTTQQCPVDWFLTEFSSDRWQVVSPSSMGTPPWVHNTAASLGRWVSHDVVKQF